MLTVYVVGVPVVTATVALVDLLPPVPVQVTV